MLYIKQIRHRSTDSGYLLRFVDITQIVELTMLSSDDKYSLERYPLAYAA